MGVASDCRRAFHVDPRDLVISTRKSYAYDLNGGARFLLCRGDCKIAPYVTAGLGQFHSQVTALAQVRWHGGTQTIELKNSDLAAAVGGGCRVFIIGRSVGIRPEVKPYFADRCFTRLTLAVFIDFIEIYFFGAGVTG